MLKSLLNKDAGRKACNFNKKDSNTDVNIPCECSCEYCEISKSTFFQEHLYTAASEVSIGSDYLGLSFWAVAFKILLSNITKIPVAFKPEL